MENDLQFQLSLAAASVIDVIPNVVPNNLSHDRVHLGPITSSRHEKCAFRRLVPLLLVDESGTNIRFFR